MRPSLVIGVTLAAVSCGCGSSVMPEGPGYTDPTSGPFQVIDDMDHGDDSLPAVPPGSSSFFWPGGPGVLGNWFVSSPAGSGGDGRIEDILPPRGDSKKACHISGDKVDRGVDLWAQLDHPRYRPVDLSAYAGIAFWARLNSPSRRLVVAVNDQGPGTFFDAEVTGSPWLTRTLAVSEWQWFVLLFDDFGRAFATGNNIGRRLDTSAIVSIDFVVGSGGEPFDLWIDDLALLCRGVCR